jgi:hypothetical protein
MTNLNTKNRGIARIIIFPAPRGFKAVCLDFDLIEEAKTFRGVESQIRESVEGYVENVCKNDLPNALLNRPAEKKYWDMLAEYQKYIIAKRNSERNFPRNVRASSFLSLPIKSLCQT